MAKDKEQYVDPGWPQHLEEGEHPVTEVVSHTAGATSPYGEDTKFPVDSKELNYVHPYTPVNRPFKR
ncbi:hypothetical protein [Corynebacterium parakroppenstedtii]|uniref:hypothetical protein n=1 Tax=Corynebacterium parakroppenstedtii TaxID=2828363 RepID=UPI001C8F7F78|nr:hypothetical protein [Corynebacterium parakroppenstedtii]MBY0795765.1 hypothetical protein [Corynebacterium parakroppenstedtii]